MKRRSLVALAAGFTLLAGPLCPGPAEPTGVLRLEILERDLLGREGSAPARVHLAGPDGKPVKGAGLPFFHDHFTVGGTVELELPPASYRYQVERGPERRRAAGTIEVRPGERAERKILLERWIDLAGRGWWSGELHLHRPVEDLPLLLRAEDLHAAPALTVWNRQDRWSDHPLPPNLLVEVEPERFLHLLGCEDERRGGALLYLNLPRSLDLREDGPEYPSPVKHLLEARALEGAWIDIEKPFWWDVPAWVATGKVDSIGIANNHLCRARMYEDEAWGRPRDAARLPPPRGNGFYTQEIYYHLLNCGLRIPPSAGSASGVLPNPVGYNRVYVRTEGQFSWDAWWRGLAAGRSFVTNGPILLAEANGRPPGEVFRCPESNGLEIDLDLRLGANDPIEAVEIIRDGEVVERIEPRDGGGPTPSLWLRPRPLRFVRSGWFLVRAIAKVPETFRFASTAPFYVEAEGKPRTVHRASVDFFLRWIDERIAALEKSEELRDPARREAVLRPQREAKAFFEFLRKEATSD